MWVELVMQDRSRLFVNLDTTFAFQENANGTTNAVSVTGVAVPVPIPYDQVKADIIETFGED